MDAFKVTPVIDPAIFEQAQTLLKENCAMLRRQTRRFYLLSGKVVCEECGHAYYPQADPAGRVEEKRWTAYRHRIKSGHCTNRMISAKSWSRSFGMKWSRFSWTQDLLKGYQESVEHSRRPGQESRAVRDLGAIAHSA